MSELVINPESLPQTCPFCGGKFGIEYDGIWTVNGRDYDEFLLRCEGDCRHLAGNAICAMAYTHKVCRETGEPWAYNHIKPDTKSVYADEIDDERLLKIRKRAEDCIRAMSEEMARLAGSSYRYPSAMRLRTKTAEDTLYLLSQLDAVRRENSRLEQLLEKAGCAEWRMGGSS